LIEAEAPVQSTREAMPGVWLVWLKCPEIAAAAKPGQFVMVKCGEDTSLPRPISIHRTNGNGELALMVNVVGKGTDWLAKRKAGDKISLFGPLGNGFTLNEQHRNLLLVAGGIGIAPLAFLAEHALKKKHGVTILIGAPTVSRLCPTELLPAGCDIINVTQDGSTGKRGLVTDFIAPNAAIADGVFTCGPMPMLRAINKLELKQPVQASLEVRMACGRGICYGCGIPTQHGQKKVCEDGPVFDLNDIAWDKIG
jgi:dihydroorotate dehydrogenase electron transfer subunit